jgi:diguanylate cyclase (GGDEF)-like protein
LPSEIGDGEVGGGVVTEEEWTGEVARSARFRLISPVIAIGAFGLIFIPCIMAGQALASGINADLVSVGIIMGFMFPLAFVLVVFGERQQRRTDEKVRSLNAELSRAVADADRLNAELSRAVADADRLNAELNDAMADSDRQARIRDTQAERQRFESRLANALDMAEGEPEVIEVIERSLSGVLPDAPVELLLADNSHAHLHRMAAVGPAGKPPSCGVDSPDRCPAARRAQVQEFTDSDDLDACPKLRNRPEGRLSALCVPVSIMGRTVGVIHATGEPGAKMDDAHVDDLATLAKLAGARIGLLRVMAETQLQASTDTLTGLLNRRSFSQRVAAVPPHLYPIAVAMADLDHFKALNDTYGHETGDRALRLFARVLRDSLRASDLASRHGGEEFAIAFPDCSAVDATRVLNTLRSQLDAAITVGGLPKYTVSFGLTESEPGEDLETVLRRADDALLQAKREGRDRVVLHDAVGGAKLAPNHGRAGIIPLLEDDFLPAD